MTGFFVPLINPAVIILKSLMIYFDYGSRTSSKFKQNPHHAQSFHFIGKLRLKNSRRWIDLERLL